MADKHQTIAGEVQVLTREQSFAELARRINALAAKGPASVGLSGGSTPKAFYTWVVANKALTPEAIARIDWHVSDERCVPLSSDDSNFGHAVRGMLDALGVAQARRFPWPVDLLPVATAVAATLAFYNTIGKLSPFGVKPANPSTLPADLAPAAAVAAAYDEAWTKASPTKAFDICLLGLGDDSHIASLWPKCPLIGKQGARFVATEWPGRGWRLTITESGLAQCGEVIVLVNGKSKAPALQVICKGPLDAAQHPGQVLRAIATKVTWLADSEAAAQL